MDAIIFLIKEHDKVRKILANINNASRRFETRKKQLLELFKKLIVHEKMEQRVWYPKLKKQEKLAKVIKHLIAEENEAEKLIKKFNNKNPEEIWVEKFKKFKKAVEHHAEEEENNLFPKVKKTIDTAEREKLCKEMKKFKAKSLHTTRVPKKRKRN